MARYDHLELVRLPEQFERRKQGGGGAPPSRDREQHSARLRNDLDAATLEQRRRRKPEFVDPSLILRVQMTGGLLENEWDRLGLTVFRAMRTERLYCSPLTKTCGSSATVLIPTNRAPAWSEARSLQQFRRSD